MTQKEIVKRNYRSLTSSFSYYTDWKIQFVNQMCTDGDTLNSPGGLLPIINEENIDDVYYAKLQLRNFSVLFIDESICFMEYIFKNELIVKHRLTFIAGSQRQSIRYFRIDYDPDGHNGPNHPESHVSFLDNSQRISVSKVILPKQFIYIINKMIFNNQCPRGEKLLSDSFQKLESNENEQNFYFEIV